MDIALKCPSASGFNMGHFPDSVFLKVGWRALSSSKAAWIASVLALSLKTHSVSSPVGSSTCSYLIFDGFHDSLFPAGWHGSFEPYIIKKAVAPLCQEPCETPVLYVFLLSAYNDFGDLQPFETQLLPAVQVSLLLDALPLTLSPSIGFPHCVGNMFKFRHGGGGSPAVLDAPSSLY